MNTRKLAFTVAAALALVAGGTAAGAGIANGPVSSGVVHGCYTSGAINGSHAFLLQDAGASCPRGTTAISWNRQGPAGPQGPRGPSGKITSLDDLNGILCRVGYNQPGTVQVLSGGSFSCTNGTPSHPYVYDEGPDLASLTSFGCGDNGYFSATFPSASTAGPNGLGAWIVVYTSNAPDQHSPPNCTSPGPSFTLADPSQNPLPGVLMDVYAGSSYTGQKPLASGVTTYHQATGGTFVINFYSTTHGGFPEAILGGVAFTNELIYT